MSIFVTIVNIVLYFVLFLYFIKPEIVIITILLLITFYLIYRTNAKNSTMGLTILAFIKNKIVSRKNPEKRYHSRYTKLSKRPRMVSTIFPVLFILIMGYLIYTQMIFFAIVTSDSMNPTFKKNDLVMMQGLSVQPDVGDIIMFDTKEALMPVTHRIVSINDETIRTKGDARQNIDDWKISKSQIHAEAITYHEGPIVIKDVGSYFLFDPNKAVTYTSMAGEDFYFFSRFMVAFKKFGLIIYIICILTYLLFKAHDVRA